MKKALVVLAVLVSTQAFAYSESAEVEFPTSNNFTRQSTISWIPVDDVNARCNAESRKRGLGGFGFGVDACSFWEAKNGQDVCTIITSRSATMHQLGHETRHCFQGNFHK